MAQPRLHTNSATAIFFLTVISASINVFFTILKIINIFSLTYYYSSYPKIINIIIFSQLADLLIWTTTLIIATLTVLFINLEKTPLKWLVLACLPTLSILLIFQADSIFTIIFGVLLSFLVTCLFVQKSSSFSSSKQLTTCLILLSIVCLALSLEAASLLTWTWNLFDYSFPFNLLPHWRFALLDLQLFNVLYPWTSWLFLVFLSCWLWIPCLKFLFSKVGSKIRIMPEKTVPSDILLPPKSLNGKVLTVGLFAIVALAVLVAYYPLNHLPASTLVGTDSTYYYNWLNQMHIKGPLTAFEMDRPFSNLLLYSAQALTATSTETIVKIAPIFCTVFLSLAVFWFVMVGTQDKRLALMSALFTVFSFQTTVSLFVYSLSNWIALIEMFLIFGLFLKSGTLKSTVLLALMGIVLLLTHPYTWEVVIAIFSAYLIYGLLRKRNEDKVKIKQLIVFLSANTLFFISYALLPFGEGLATAAGVVMNYTLPTFGFSNLLNVQNGLENMVKVWVGGLFGNPLLILLAVIGIFAMVDYAKRYNRLMLVWVAVPFLALFAFSPESFFYYRIVYLVPIQIFAASGLNLALDKLEAATMLKSTKSFQMLKILIIILVVAFLLNYSLRASDVVPLHILAD
jgi:hypothetical protein